MTPRNQILLVEDNPDDAELTRVALEDGGLVNEVVWAKDGEAALERLLGPNAGPLPQLVLLDLNMPKLGGLDVLRRLRAAERTKVLPVVILTTSSEEEDVVASYRLGANSYVRKPVDFEQFSEAVRQLRLYWLVLNEPPPGDRDAGA